MRTITIEVMNEGVIPLLQNLEQLQLLRLSWDGQRLTTDRPLVAYQAKYEGKMTPQPLEEIDRQLKELRDEWTRDEWS